MKNFNRNCVKRLIEKKCGKMDHCCAIKFREQQLKSFAENKSSFVTVCQLLVTEFGENRDSWILEW